VPSKVFGGEDHSLPGERNPQSAAEEFAPSPQGENVLDASMISSWDGQVDCDQKGDRASAQKVHRNLAGQVEKPTALVVNDCRWREDMSRAIDSLIPWFGGALGGRVRCLSLDAD